MKIVTKTFPILILALLLAALAGCGSTDSQSGTGEYFDDTVITGKVKTAIARDPALSSFEINVETLKGAVQLSGFVSTQAEATKAVQLARGVAGVKSVHNDIRLR